MITYYIGREGPVHWELNRKTHILSFEGEGALPDFHPFHENLPSWMPLKEQVHEVHMGEGITHIGDYAFYPYDYGVFSKMRSRLHRIVFPFSLESIGKFAFRANNRLQYIDLRGHSELRSIEEYAFASCFQAKGVDLSGCERLGYIDRHAFWACDELSYINLERCFSLSVDILQSLRNEIPLHIPIIMPNGKVWCDESSFLSPNYKECRIYLKGTRLQDSCPYGPYTKDERNSTPA